MTISIPTDNDGFVLNQCPLCGEYFKVTPGDYEDDNVLELCCPNCGLISENYFTEDVIELALTMTQNYATKLVHNEMKKLENKINTGIVSFKAGKQPNDKYESPIYATIEAMKKYSYSCCNKTIKIKPLLKMIGSYCPFCGVKEFEAKQN